MNIVITGANKGIGLELAKQAIAKGARVFCGVRNPGAATELREVLGKNGEVFGLDISSDASVRLFVETLRTRTKDIDVLINNAGVYLDGQNTGIEALESQMLLETFNVNAVGPVRMTRAMIPFLKNGKSPKVASLSSLMGSLTDNKAGGSYAYRMSKTAVNMFVKTLAVDESWITAIALHPGWVKTEMGGRAAPLEPSKSAEGIWTVIEASTVSDSGKFFNHAGRELPW